MPIVATYIRYGGDPTGHKERLRYFAVTNIDPSFVDEDGDLLRIVPVKTTMKAFYGTETTDVVNLSLPKGKYRLRFAIRGVFHELLASEYASPNDPNTYTSPGDDLSGYEVKNNFFKFLATLQHRSTSNPIRFNYPFFHGTATWNQDGEQANDRESWQPTTNNWDREFEGVVTKFLPEDAAGVGSGQDYPVWPFTMEFEVAHTIAVV